MGTKYKTKIDVSNCSTLSYICTERGKESIDYWLKDYIIFDYEISSDCKFELNEKDILLAQQKIQKAVRLRLEREKLKQTKELLAQAKQDSIEQSWKPKCDFPDFKIVKTLSKCGKGFVLSTSQKYDVYQWWHESKISSKRATYTTGSTRKPIKLRVKKGACVSTFETIQPVSYTHLTLPTILLV